MINIFGVSLIFLKIATSKIELERIIVMKKNNSM